MNNVTGETHSVRHSTRLWERGGMTCCVAVCTAPTRTSDEWKFNSSNNNGASNAVEIKKKKVKKLFNN